MSLDWEHVMMLSGMGPLIVVVHSFGELVVDLEEDVQLAYPDLGC